MRISTISIVKIPTKNQKFPQKNALLSEYPSFINSSIALGNSSTNETDIMTPPENPNPRAKIRLEGLLVKNTNAAPIVVDRPARLVRINAVTSVSKLTGVAWKIILRSPIK